MKYYPANENNNTSLASLTWHPHKTRRSRKTQRLHKTRTAHELENSDVPTKPKKTNNENNSYESIKGERVNPPYPLDV